MTPVDPRGDLTDDEELKERLDEAAKQALRPHDDEEERRRRQENAREAGRNPRREGEGIHP